MTVHIPSSLYCKRNNSLIHTINHENDDAIYQLHHYCNCTHLFLFIYFIYYLFIYYFLFIIYYYILFIVVYYCFTEMHLCPILVLVGEIVTAHFVLDSRLMCQFVSLSTAHLCISGDKLC